MVAARKGTNGHVRSPTITRSRRLIIRRSSPPRASTGAARRTGSGAGRKRRINEGSRRGPSFVDSFASSAERDDDFAGSAAGVQAIPAHQSPAEERADEGVDLLLAEVV